MKKILALLLVLASVLSMASAAFTDQKDIDPIYLQAVNTMVDNGIIAGAGLDVFAEEPSKNPALYTHPRVSVTPHIGGQTEEAQSRIGQEIVAIMKAFEKE